MKFIVNVDQLQAAISDVKTVFESGLGIMDLTILITTEGKKRLCIECASQSSYFRKYVEAQVSKSGEMAISATYLLGMTFPGEEVEMEVNRNTLSFKSGRMSGKFEALSDDTKIERLKFKGETALALDAKLFNRLVDALLFDPTVSDQENSLRLIANRKKHRLTAITADKYRSAIFETDSLKSEKELDKVLAGERKKEEEAEGSKPIKGKGKDKKKAPKAGQKSKEEKEEIKRAVRDIGGKVLVADDFDFAFDAGFLISIKNLFDGKLRISGNDKLICMKDDGITLIYPSKTNQTGKQVFSYIEGLEKSKAKVSAEFNPDEALDMINAAVSVAPSGEGKVHIKVEKGVMAVRLRSDNAETKTSFDAKVQAGKGEQFRINSGNFGEFLSMIGVFADDKIDFKVFAKAVLLKAPKITYVMPLAGKSD